ncbi:MAG: hypothetical protein JSR44_15670 [Spirochaetes bacterium]|nr:hypothetical protein [Spirochaetota bacterium]
MRTTIDLPVDIYRKAKAEAALRGVKLRDMVVTSLSRELNRADSELGRANTVRVDEFMASLEELSGQFAASPTLALGELMKQRISTSSAQGLKE